MTDKPPHLRVISSEVLMIGDQATRYSRADGWFSALTGHGVAGRDKRVSSQFQSDQLDHVTIEEMWRGDDIAARIVEVVPDEAMRTGYDLIVGDKVLAEDLLGEHEELKVDETFRYAKKVERAFGGSAIFPVINDSCEDMRMPLNENRITKIQHLQVFEPRELMPCRYYENPLKPKYGEPMTYRLFPRSRGLTSGELNGVEIHESRLIIFPGLRVTRSQVSSSGFGDSVLNRCYAILRDYNISWASATALLHDFAQAAFKIKGLAQLIAQDRDDVIRARIQAVELARSTIRAVMMDAEEEFERKSTPTAGLAELLTAALTRVAMTADMPIVRLAGTSPAGFSTGESETRQWYDRIDVIRKLGMKPQLARLCKLQMRSLQGPTKGKEPKRWSVNFRPLWQMTDIEKAQLRQTVANTDNIYFQMGAVSPEEIARSRWGGDEYSPEMNIDFQERALLNEMGETAVPAPPKKAPPEGGAPPPGPEGAPPPVPPPPGGPVAPRADGDTEEAIVHEEDDDGDPETPPGEFVVIQVQGHARKIKLRRKRTDRFSWRADEYDDEQPRDATGKWTSSGDGGGGEKIETGAKSKEHLLAESASKSVGSAFFASQSAKDMLGTALIKAPEGVSSKIIDDSGNVWLVQDFTGKLLKQDLYFTGDGDAFVDPHTGQIHAVLPKTRIELKSKKADPKMKEDAMHRVGRAKAFADEHAKLMMNAAMINDPEAKATALEAANKSLKLVERHVKAAEKYAKTPQEKAHALQARKMFESIKAKAKDLSNYKNASAPPKSFAQAFKKMHEIDKAKALSKEGKDLAAKGDFKGALEKSKEATALFKQATAETKAATAEVKKVVEEIKSPKDFQKNFIKSKEKFYGESKNNFMEAALAAKHTGVSVKFHDIDSEGVTLYAHPDGTFGVTSETKYPEVKNTESSGSPGHVSLPLPKNDFTISASIYKHKNALEKASEHEKYWNDRADAIAKDAKYATVVEKNMTISRAEFTQHRADFSKNLQKNETVACLYYSSEGDRVLNHALRTDTIKQVSDAQDIGTTKIDHMRDSLDSAIAKSPMPKDTVVARGISGPWADKFASQLEVGSTFTEKGYTSTGATRSFSGAVEMLITVKAGQKAAPIPSQYPDENEYLLPRETTFRVKKKEKVGGKYVFHLEID